MPLQTPCPRCHRIGFVRFEHVIKGGRTERHYYCGGCEHTWAIDDHGLETANYGRPPERSRRDR